MRFYIEAENYDYSQLAQTTLTAAVNVSDTSINVTNTNLFQVGKFLVFGTLGQEKTEAKAISSIDTANNIITLSSGALFSHNNAETVHLTNYDTVQVWKATQSGTTEPVDSDYALLEEKLIDFENLTTLFEDLSGLSTSRYKIIFKNSVDLTTTTLSDSYAVQGEEISDYCSVAYVKELLNINKNDYLISRLIKSASDYIDTQANRYNDGSRLSYHNAVELLDTEIQKYTYFPVNTPIVSINSAEVMLNGALDYVYSQNIFNYKTYIKLPKITETSVFNTQTTLKTRNQGLKLDMQVGFFDAGSVPYDLKYLCARMVMHEYKRFEGGQNPDIKTKTIGRFKVDYNDTIKQSGISDFNNIIGKYRKVRVAMV